MKFIMYEFGDKIINLSIFMCDIICIQPELTPLDTLLIEYKKLNKYKRFNDKECWLCDVNFIFLSILLLLSPFIFMIFYHTFYNNTIYNNSILINMPNITLQKCFYMNTFVYCGFGSDGNKYYCCKNYNGDCDMYESSEYMRKYGDYFYFLDKKPHINQNIAIMLLFMFVMLVGFLINNMIVSDKQLRIESNEAIHKIKTMEYKDLLYNHKDLKTLFVNDCLWYEPNILLIIFSVICIIFASAFINGTNNMPIFDCNIILERHDTTDKFENDIINLKITKIIDGNKIISYKNFKKIYDIPNKFMSKCYTNNEININKPIIAFPYYKTFVIVYYIITICVLLNKMSMPITENEYMQIINLHIKQIV